MKTKGKPRELTHPVTGKKLWSMYPLTREEAIVEDIAKYHPQTPCPVHANIPEGRAPVVYTKTNICGCCAQRNAVYEYNAAIAAGEPTNPSMATAMGKDYYWMYHEHRQCGHSGKKTLTGKCYVCAHSEAPMSPRQEAVAKGELWYMPASNDPCKNGHIALRRVDNGTCKECADAGKKRRQLPMYKDPAFADMIMDRNAAKDLGFKVFRTGEPCINGHRGFRYVSTGGCIQCLKGE